MCDCHDRHGNDVRCGCPCHRTALLRAGILRPSTAVNGPSEVRDA